MPLTPLADLLAAGDLRTDGFANEAVQLVIENPVLLDTLLEALRSDDPPTRGHAADALEKAARVLAVRIAPYAAELASQACQDSVPMVRWHLAMVLGHLSVVPAAIAPARKALLALLLDKSAFVRSWAITSLTILARRAPRHAAAIARAIAPLAFDHSAAVAKRSQTALWAVADRDRPLPRSWVKYA